MIQTSYLALKKLRQGSLEFKGSLHYKAHSKAKRKGEGRPLISLLRRQANLCEFKTSLSYIVRSYLKTERSLGKFS